MALLQRMLQYTLDLFDPQPVAAPVPRPRRIAKPKPVAPAQPEREHALWSEDADSAVFRHPRASRELRLGDALVAYEFKRGKRRTIGFTVGPDGLVVSAPKWSPLVEVDAAVREKADWILKKLHESRQRHQRLESARIVWRHGASLPFLGESVLLVLDPSHAFGAVGAQLKSAADALSLSLIHI